MVNVRSVIGAMASAAEVTPIESELQAKQKPVITISRGMGSGGNEVAEALAARLNLHCYSGEILDRIAEEAGEKPELVNKLHERMSKASDAWLYSIVFQQNLRKEDYIRHLTTVIRWLYTQGGVILGRGGNIILAGRDVLRVRINASLEVRAKRLAMQEQISFSEAEKRIIASDKTRADFMQRMFHSSYSDANSFDLMINMDRFSVDEQVVDILFQAVTSMGLYHHSLVLRK